MTGNLREWILARLEAVSDQPRVLVRDPLHLLRDSAGDVHIFARERGFTVILAATNLVLRELYELTIADSETTKILVVDRSPARRRIPSGATRAPAPFYPDFLATVAPAARIDLDLRQFLREATGDANWPHEVSVSPYPQLIVRHLDAVFRAHRNLRTAHPGRFTDHDFKTIVAFAALGVPESAFKRLGAEEYWRIGLLRHAELEQLESVAPEVTGPIRAELARAPAPFRWFADRDADAVVRAFYLAAILAQHVEHWDLLLANVDPALKPFAGIDRSTLRDSTPKLVQLDPDQARDDLDAVERGLDQSALQLLLLDQLKIASPSGFAAVIENERYSTLIRSLALLLALDDLLSARPSTAEHDRVAAVLDPATNAGSAWYVDSRPSTTWSKLKEAYGLARDVQSLRSELAGALKDLKPLKTDRLTFDLFRQFWNGRRLNRIEYFLSALERLIGSADLLPRSEAELPAAFAGALKRIRQRIEVISADVFGQLDELNRRFQDLVAARYPGWVNEENGEESAGAEAKAHSSAPVLTARFLERCLKPNWDPQQEKAAVFIFDGMRYDIWDELLRPVLLDRLELLADLPGSSILPSETQLTRKAISAGTFPDEFDSGASEARLLKDGLSRAFGYDGPVKTVTPEGAGTGETVRFRAGNLDVFIFELCDKELHAMHMRTLPDGREVPSRPLAFIYEQHVKNIIDTEVLAIFRNLAPGTKVFITADHGFGRVGRQPIWFSQYDLNESDDCKYLNCWLKVPFDQAELTDLARGNLIAFTPSQLRLPKKETKTLVPGGPTTSKDYRAVVFPRVGYSFSRQGSPYRPNPYSHGGISIQELMIPMVVLRVKARDEGLIALDPIEGPAEVIEGEDAEFRMRIRRATGTDAGTAAPRLDVEATYSQDPDRFALPRQVLYLADREDAVRYRFRPDPADATDEERRRGVMERTLTVAVSYRDGRRTVRASRTHRFTIRLNADRIARRVGNLGSILGLAPRNMR